MHNRSVWLCVSALFAALLALGSWISVPAAVPFTMQTFVVFMMLFLLPPAYAFGATAVYLLLGAIGLPVFAGFQGGFAILLGPLGGFLWGFLLMAAVLWLWRPHSSRVTLVCVLTATALCYLCGTVWFALYVAPSPQGLAFSVLTSVAPFVIPDALKLLLAWRLARRIRPRLPL